MTGRKGTWQVDGDYRITHEYDAVPLARHLDALETTTAQAANEVRMAAQMLIARLPADTRPGDDRRGDHA